MFFLFYKNKRKTLLFSSWKTWKRWIPYFMHQQNLSHKRKIKLIYFFSVKLTFLIEGENAADEELNFSFSTKIALKSKNKKYFFGVFVFHSIFFSSSIY